MKLEDMVKVIDANTGVEARGPVVITSGNETKEPEMSLKEAIAVLQKYAKMLGEEVKKEEGEAADKTGY